jgi:hypothetical protein
VTAAEDLIELPSSFITLDPGNDYSDFGVKKLRNHGLSEFVDNIKAHQPIDRNGAERLLTLSLPLVIKLGELYRMYSNHSTSAQLLRPVFFFDTTSAEMSANFEDLVHSVNQQIATFISRNPEVSDVWLAFSSMRFDDEFIHCVARLRNKLPPNVHLVGPTSGELKAIPWIKNVDDPLLLKKLLGSLLEVGFASLDGGTDLSVLSTACEVGLKVSVAQLLRAGLVGFIDDLFTIRSTLGGYGNFAIWTPRFQSMLDDLDPVSTSPLGIEILRAIVISRLVLPSHVCIQAPVSLLRTKFAHITLNFGAADLGYVSATGDINNGLPGYNEVWEVLIEA